MKTILVNILMKEWDPIGVNEIPEAQGEYNGYALKLESMINAGSTQSEIARYLLEVEKSFMGLNGDMQRTERVAKKIWESMAGA